jgi:acyl transferase domain-containing protein
VPPTDVAIIGLACRLPAAANPDGFWRLLCDGSEATALPGDAAEFDADFFNLSPREAAAMDPRQRLALELTWELFEDAFVVPESQRGQPVAVYLGAMNDDYAFLTFAADNVDHYSFAGVSRSMIANRISFAFGLHGASMSVDTGQSSSLVAVHLACESLRSGASPLAIAGGMHLNLSRETAALETEFGAMSASGHTYAFDARADGYVRSEGGGLVLLKPLRAALDDGDHIHAVIRGSAVGNAGHGAAGVTVPSAAAQVDVIRRALSSAGLESGQVDYVEAHGTGTQVGDPIEATALGEAFGRRERPLNVGSVKTNIGHTGGAAGIAGLLKTVLAVENAFIPSSLNFAHPGTELAAGLRIATALTPWPEGDGPRRAGVSSLGMGGTNAHVVLEEAPAQAPEQAPAASKTPAPKRGSVVPWVLSASTERALADQAGRLAAHVAADPGLSPADVGWSLATTRSALEHRAVLVGSERDPLLSALTGLALGEPDPDVVVGRARSVGKTVFVFPGQGSQWLGMGRDLCERFPVFAEAFDQAVAALDPHLRFPLRQVLFGDDAALLESTEFAQPALFAVEVASTALLRSAGLTPDFVMGHSVGEITAAQVAGVLSLQDAAKVVAARGRLMAALPAGGVMVAAAAGEDEVAPLLAEGVSIAAVNGPTAVVISGADASVAAVTDRLAERGRRTHRLAVSHAFHSVLMEPMLEEFSQLLAGISAAPPRIGLVSNLSGQLAGPGYGSPQYWVEHVRRPVRFADGVRAAEALGAGTFVEVGPAAGLAAAVEQSLSAEHHATAVAAMAKDRPEVASLVAALGQLFAAGVGVRWEAVFEGLDTRRVPLPTYAFQRQRFWVGNGVEAPAGDATGRSIPNLAARLEGLAPADRHRELVKLVCSQAAVVLGHPSRDGSGYEDAEAAERAFQDLGFDSMAGVELRNRLSTETGLILARTLIFDYPTPIALADYLGQKLFGGPDDESDEEKLRALLTRIPVEELRRTGLLDKLSLLAEGSESPSPGPTVSDDVIDALSTEDLIAMALNPVEDGELDH